MKIEPRKPDTKFREAIAEAEAGRKNITKLKPKQNPSKMAYKQVEAVAEASNV